MRLVGTSADFLPVMDECYADIWRADRAPTGMLEAAAGRRG